MNLSKNIASQFREVYLNGRWVANTNIKEQINDVSVKEARQQVGTLNTIAALVFHLNYYLKGIIDALESGKLEIRDRFSFDFSPPKNAKDWNSLKATFIENSELLADKIDSMNNEDFSRDLIDPKYGNMYRNIHGLIEHGYYHFGQIVIIKKMIREHAV